MIDLLGWFTNTATIGGMIVMTVFTTAIVIYIFLLRWIHAGGESDAGQ
jgi:hypothetical protein